MILRELRIAKWRSIRTHLFAKLLEVGKLQLFELGSARWHRSHDAKVLLHTERFFR